jgi:hypothetical protein
LLHREAAAQASVFCDEARERRERTLAAGEGDGARVEDERARVVMLELEAL